MVRQITNKYDRTANQIHIDDVKPENCPIIIAKFSCDNKKRLRILAESGNFKWGWKALENIGWGNTNEDSFKDALEYGYSFYRDVFVCDTLADLALLLMTLTDLYSWDLDDFQEEFDLPAA
jgi:hypothetical protein